MNLLKNDKNKFWKYYLLILPILFAGCFFVISSANAATEVYYSVGQSTDTEWQTGSPNISISSGIATFSVAQTGNIGVGDEITYNTTSIAYISGKISTTQWSVVTAVGETPDDATEETVDSIKRAFTSLFAAVAGIDAGENILAGAGDADHLNNYNLVSGDYILNIPCYYDSGPDTTAVNIAGWTTDANNYIKIYTPNNTSSEVNFSQRHAGKWDESKYRLEVDVSGWGKICLGGIVVSTIGIRIDGLQVKAVGASGGFGSGIILSGDLSSDARVSNNLVKGSLSGTIASVIGINVIGNSKIWNNVVYDFVNGIKSMTGISLGTGTDPGTSYVYNNTVYDSYIGYERISGTVIAKNNIAQETAVGYSGTFDASSTNNLSNLADATGLNPQNSKTVSFIDADGDDFHLMSSDSAAKNLGVDLSADSNLSFSSDIDGESRLGTWDIGADDADVVAPVLSNGLPTGSSSETTQTLQVTTNETATCKYGTTADTEYDSIANTFANTGSTSHSQSLTDLADGAHTYYFRCQDVAENENDSDYEINFTIDTTAPALSDGLPSGSSSETTQTLQVTTSETATCKYSTSSDTDYASIANTFTNTDATTHTQELTSLTVGSYTYYIRCQDSLNNSNTSDYEINFSVIAEEEEEEEEDQDELEIDDVEYSSTKDTITIKWETNNDADSKVKYGTADGHLEQKETDNDEENKHKIVLEDLDSDTTYYFRIYSEDEYGDEEKTKVYSQKTKKDLLAKTFSNMLTAKPTVYDVYKEENQEQQREDDSQGESNQEENNQQQKEVKSNLFTSKISKKDDKAIFSELKFKIVDSDGNAIPHLPVTIHSEPQDSITDENGIATFKDVPAGEHTLIFAYNDENFEKRISIAEPVTDREIIQAEIITIKAEKDALPIWIWGVIGGLVFILLVVIFYKKKKV